MKVYALVGKSGTGKSYQAQNLCKELNIEGIIDDGLFIYENKVMAGISAKRQSTKVGAVKTALFNKEEHQQEVAASIRENPPQKLLVIGTSDEMVRRIAKRLELPKISETVYITEITTAAEREIARKQRQELGKHVIPVPAFQLKRQFSGYFVSPLRIFRGWSAINKGGFAEKAVVRPTYSYLGDYKLSDKVFSDIIECVANEIEGVDTILRVTAFTAVEGVELSALVIMRYGGSIVAQAAELQKKAARQVEKMTAFNVNRFDIEIRGLK